MIGDAVCSVCFCDFEENESQVVWGPCFHPFHQDCITRYAREKRIKKLLSSLKLFDSRQEAVRKWNALMEDFGGECALCRHAFKRCEVDWIHEEEFAVLPKVTKEEIFLYIPYDISKRTYALRIWGYHEVVAVVEEDAGLDDGIDEDNRTVGANDDDDEDDDVQFVCYHPSTTPSQRVESPSPTKPSQRVESPSPTTPSPRVESPSPTTPSQRRESPSATPSQRRESRLISHVFSRIDRPRNRHRQNLNFRMQRLRQQGWSERQIEHHFRNN